MVKILNPKRLLTTHYSLPTNNAGFTLLEVLIVTAIIAILSATLLLNFGAAARNRTARSQVASVVVSDIRRAQSMALSGARFHDSIVCGYGIHYFNSTTYIIYAKPVPTPAGLCSSVSTRNYDETSSPPDLKVETKKVSNQNMELRSSFYDIFFESPDPKTYINNSASLADPPVAITIQLSGQSVCVVPQTCTQIDVYTSGQINLTD